jgi:hypothetical protein
MSKGVSYLVAILACIGVIFAFSMIMATANLDGVIFYIIMFAICTTVWKVITSFAKKDNEETEEKQDDTNNIS